MEGTIPALVAGGVDYGDSHRVVYLLTRRGRIAVFAHGAKRSRRRFAGALDPFTTIRATLTTSKKHKGGMPTITSAVVESSRLRLRADLDRIALAGYITELGSRVAPENEPSDSIFDLVQGALDHLLDHRATIMVRRAFELLLLHELGYSPQLGGCVVCGEVQEPALSRIYVDFMRGGLCCTDHRDVSPAIGPGTLAWTRSVLADPTRFDPMAGFDEAWAERAARTLAPATHQFYARLLDRPLKSLTLLEVADL